MRFVKDRRRLAVALLALISLCCADVAEAAGKWRTFPDCRMISGEYYDGDSFHVKRGRKHDIYRLYFVDTAETDEELETRIDDQADYWKLAPDQMHKLGEEAKRFTADFLKDGFTVETRFEDARGNSKLKRSYAFVRTGEEDEDDLAVALVEAGLARIYGNMVDLPDGTSEQKYLARLRAAERHARQQKLGAWGVERKDVQPLRTQTIAAALVSPGAPAAWTNVVPQNIVITRPLALYSLHSSAFVSTMTAGSTVRVLRAESPSMVRIRFARDEKIYEAKCRRVELGL